MATPTTLPATFVSGNTLTALEMNNLRGAFRVMQINSTIKTDTFTAATATYTDVTGLSVSITPAFTTSKILIVASLSGSQDSGTDPCSIRLVRDSTAIAVGDAAGSRIQASTSFSAADGNVVSPASIVFLDSPATTSATTYKIQVRSNQSAANTVFINRCEIDTNSAISSRTVSTITVFEVSA